MLEYIIFCSDPASQRFTVLYKSWWILMNSDLWSSRAKFLYFDLASQSLNFLYERLWIWMMSEIWSPRARSLYVDLASQSINFLYEKSMNVNDFWALELQSQIPIFRCCFSERSFPLWKSVDIDDFWPLELHSRIPVFWPCLSELNNTMVTLRTKITSSSHTSYYF